MSMRLELQPASGAYVQHCSVNPGAVTLAAHNNKGFTPICCRPGTAAVNVGGSTLHSFAGMLNPDKPKVKLAEDLWAWQRFKDGWRLVDALLVDEISMVDCETLEKVQWYAGHGVLWCAVLVQCLRGGQIQAMQHVPGVGEYR